MSIAHKAGVFHLVPPKPRRYYTVYYTCDAIITDASDLCSRLCNDTDEEDGLLRLVPDRGKEMIEFSRTSEGSFGTDLKVVSWGAKGTELHKIFISRTK